MTDPYISVTADVPRVRTRQIKLYGSEAFEGMRLAGRVTASILDSLTTLVTPGISTEALDSFAREAILTAGAVPANLGYRGYTHASCISVNHVVCHGIPGTRTLKEGDILNIDLTSILNGWHGDASRMYFVGDVSLKAKRLVDIAYESLMLGIEQAKPGNYLGDIGHAVQRNAERHRCGVVRDFVGHGVGLVYHDAPDVPHFAEAGSGPMLRPGMIFTIEPMINSGGAGVKMLPDGWTVVTRDRSLSAQFEHSIGITETGCEIFTTSQNGFNRPPYC